MEKVIPAAEANRKFSQVLRGVREGSVYIVTSHGQSVAKIMPVTKDDRVAARARRSLMKRLCAQAVVAGGHWTRDELYEDSE